MLNQILSQFGSAKKSVIGVTVSPSVGLEMIEINPKTKTIEKYACKFLEYDYARREIANYDQFRETLGELFDELRISRKSNIVLTLPSVYYGTITLPSILTDEGINSAIISEVEELSYIFKRQDPVVSWFDNSDVYNDSENKSILYGVLQQAALDEISAACVEVGCSIVAVETAPNSLLKTLSYNQLAEEQMVEGTVWHLMIINPNSYSMIELNGKNIIDYKEEPLALKSFENDEIYDAIISSTQLALQAVTSNYLYIVSKTDLVSAEVLSMKIPFNGHIKFLECNKYVQNPLMLASYNILPNMVLKITPEAVGSGIYNISDYPLKFNLLGINSPAKADSVVDEYPMLKIGNFEIELNSENVRKITFLLAIIIVIPSLIILFVLNYLTGTKQKELDTLNSEIDGMKKTLTQYEGIDKKNKFDEKLEINTVYDINKIKLIYYSAIGMNLPSETWLIYLKIYDNKKIDIIGRSVSVENVYKFYKGLKMSVINSDLRLNRLELSTDTPDNIVIQNYNKIKPTFYEFEITNLTDAELKAQEGEISTSEKSGDNNQQQSSSRKRKGFLFDNFLNNADNIENLGNNNQGSSQPPASSGSGGDAPPKDLPANLDSIEKF
ncbi:hypothetical protein IJG72_07530 [bacterium]|nr:hypothetical protein [bacterium]